ncbi:MAG: dipeptidase [Bacteroidetes bacterium]|nr:dipeptidase [Bacteroidota bacterium]
MIKNIITTAFCTFLAFTGISGNKSDEKLAKKAAEIHRSVFTVDSHTDTPMRLMTGDFDINQRHDPQSSKVDFPRMKEGGLDGIFFAVFTSQGKRNQEAFLKIKNEALEITDTIYAVLKRNQAVAGLALKPQDAYSLKKEGKIAVFIGMENGYPLGLDLSMVETFFKRGVRYITLCHTRNNDLCDSSTDTLCFGGLGPFGKEVVKEMNRLGMMVDVSHMSDKSFYDVLHLSGSPVIASHSCSRALCDNPRNLTDEMLMALAANGGVVQMCILSAYVKADPNPARDSAHAALRKKYRDFDGLTKDEMKAARKDWHAIDDQYPGNLATVSDVVDHIDHMVKVAGIDHVGIGTDFDGGGGVKGCNDVSGMGSITLELVKRGYSKSQIRKIWGGNLMRVMKQNLDNAGK